MDKLITYIVTHSEADLAKRIGVSKQSVNLWKLGHTRPSPQRALDIERATEGAVTRHDLYPDLWPPA